MNNVNLFNELKIERDKKIDSKQLMESLKKIWHENDLTLKNINKKNDGGVNSLDFDKMNSNNIFHSSIIKKICVKYRLRFLDSELFKGEYPQNITKIIRGLENKHNTKLKNFMIMAPSKLFKIKSPDDPILFAPIGNGYYYLIHKWGNDLHPFRKLTMWPFKNIWNLLITILSDSPYKVTMLAKTYNRIIFNPYIS